MENIHAKRRKQFMSRMEGGVALIPAAREVTRSYDTHFPFRQSNDFFYLTGFPEPEAVALLCPNHPEHKFVLFVRPRDKEREIWDGRRYGPEGAKELFGADAAYPLTEIDEKLPQYLENNKILYHGWGNDHGNDSRVYKWLGAVRAKARKGIDAPTRFIHNSEITHDLRLFKDEHCLAAMRKAGQLSKDAHRHGMKVTKPGMSEALLQAEMEHFCRMRGSEAQAYGSIVASGDNANILHYHENNMPMKDGDLVLVDFGCEINLYASDITRTWPVNGKFTPAQRKVYDLVLKAQQAAIDTARAGNTIRRVHEVSSLTLAEGLCEWGILKGDAEKHMRVCIGDDEETKFDEKEPVLKDFYMHGTSHWIGMDVHDCGAYRPGGKWRELQPGMCITVEPGLYFSRDNEKAPKELRGIGVRIEDDILITKGAAENLTIGLPRTADEVEHACAHG